MGGGQGQAHKLTTEGRPAWHGQQNCSMEDRREGTGDRGTHTHRMESTGRIGIGHKLTTEDRREGQWQQKRPCGAGGSWQGQEHPEQDGRDVGQDKVRKLIMKG